MKNIKKTFNLLIIALVFLASCKNNLVTENAGEKSKDGNCNVNLTITNNFGVRTVYPSHDTNGAKLPAFADISDFTIKFSSKKGSESFTFTETVSRQEDGNFTCTLNVPCGIYDVTVEGYKVETVQEKDGNTLVVKTIIFFGTEKNVNLRNQTQSLSVLIDYNTEPIYLIEDTLNEGFFNITINCSLDIYHEFGIETDSENLVTSGLTATLESVSTGEKILLGLVQQTSSEDGGSTGTSTDSDYVFQINNTVQVENVDGTITELIEPKSIKPGYYRLSIKGPDPDRQTTMKALLSEDLILIGTRLNTTGTIEVKGAVSADVTYYASDSVDASGDGSTEDYPIDLSTLLNQVDRINNEVLKIKMISTNMPSIDIAAIKTKSNMVCQEIQFIKKGDLEYSLSYNTKTKIFTSTRSTQALDFYTSDENVRNVTVENVYFGLTNNVTLANKVCLTLVTTDEPSGQPSINSPATLTVKYDESYDTTSPLVILKTSIDPSNCIEVTPSNSANTTDYYVKTLSDGLYEKIVYDITKGFIDGFTVCSDKTLTDVSKKCYIGAVFDYIHSVEKLPSFETGTPRTLTLDESQTSIPIDASALSTIENSDSNITFNFIKAGGSENAVFVLKNGTLQLAERIVEGTEISPVSIDLYATDYSDESSSVTKQFTVGNAAPYISSINFHDGTSVYFTETDGSNISCSFDEYEKYTIENPFIIAENYAPIITVEPKLEDFIINSYTKTEDTAGITIYYQYLEPKILTHETDVLLWTSDSSSTPSYYVNSASSLGESFFIDTTNPAHSTYYDRDYDFTFGYYNEIYISQSTDITRISPHGNKTTILSAINDYQVTDIYGDFEENKLYALHKSGSTYYIGVYGNPMSFSERSITPDETTLVQLPSAITSVNSSLTTFCVSDGMFYILDESNILHCDTLLRENGTITSSFTDDYKSLELLAILKRQLSLTDDDDLEIKDMIVQEGNLYVLASFQGMTSSNDGYSNVKNARGCIASFSLSDIANSTDESQPIPEIYGWSNNTDVYVTSPQKNFSADNYTWTFHTPADAKDGFYNPIKFIAVMPKKLVIADDGQRIVFTDSTVTARETVRNVDNVVTFDLEKKVIEAVTELECSSQTIFDYSASTVAYGSYFAGDTSDYYIKKGE